MRYLVSAVVALAAVAALALIYAGVLNRSNPALAAAVPLPLEHKTDSTAIDDDALCVDVADVRLGAVPSELEYAAIRAAVAHELAGRPETTYILKGVSVPAGSIDQYVLEQRLKFARVVAPSIVQGLRYLSEEPVELDPQRFDGLRLLFATPDHFAELPDTFDMKRWEQLGYPRILSVSRAGIDCTLSNAFVYVRLDTGFRSGASTLVELSASDGSWSVVHSELLSNH